MKAVFIKSCTCCDQIYIFLYIHENGPESSSEHPYLPFIIEALSGNTARGPRVPGRLFSANLIADRGVRRTNPSHDREWSGTKQ